ncbi:MAG: YadA-like family protein, partial [Alphaproteobacteria bacterium]|nr:YadA-like family protein [Alphaproteobacteria bacterium]
ISALTTRMGTAEGDIDSLEGRMDTAESNIATNTSNIGTMSELANTNYAKNAGNLVAAISAVDTQTKNNTDSIGTINTTLGNIAGATGHYMGNATDVAGKLGALDSQVYDIAADMSTLDDKLGEMKPTAQTKGNINGGAFNTTDNTVAKNLEKLDTMIGNLSDANGAGKITGGDVATKLTSLHGMIDSGSGEIEILKNHVGSWDTTTSHDNIDQRKSLTANVEDLGDKIGTFDASGSLEHLDTGMSISQNMQSLDKAIVDVAEDVGTLEAGHKNVDANLSLADNIENLGDKIGDTSGWAAGDTVASKIATNAGNISDLQSLIGGWDNNTYANIDKSTGATLTHNVEHLGEIIGTITSGVNITAEPFSADNTVAMNLMSIDKIVGNVASVTQIIGDDVATKLASLNTKIDEASGDAIEEAKAYTDSKLAGYTVDEQGNHIPADMVIGDEAKTITIGKTQSVGSSEELIAGAKIDTEGRTVEIAAQKDNGDKTALDMDAINQKINLGAERDNGDVKSGLDIDNQNEIIELLTADDNTKRSSGIKIDNDDSGKQTIVIGSKDTYGNKEFGITVTSDFSEGGKSKVEIGDGTDKVTISEGGVETTGDMTSHGDLQVDGMANIGTENGKQVTIMNGNVYADGKVSSSEVVTKTAQIDSSATIGKEGESQVKIADGNIEADGKVTSDAVETKTAQIDTSATIGTGDDTVAIANGNIEATGNITAHGDLQVDGAATFGDANGKHVTIDDGTVTASESVVVGSTDGTNVTLGKDGSITSTGADNTKVEIADGVITTTGSDGKQVIIGNGKVTADAIDVEGIEAKTGTFGEKVEVGSGESKVTIAGGNIDALSGEFKNSLKLGENVVNKIDTGTKPVTSDYADADKAVATVATINATVGDAAGLTGANLSSKGADGEATVADHLGSLNDAIGDRTFTNENVVASGDNVTDAFDKIDIALGNVAGVNGRYANTGVVATDMAAVDAQVAQNADNIGDMGDLTHNAISDKDNLTKAMNSLAANVEAGMGGEFDQDGKWSAQISNDKAVTYGTISADSLSGAIEQVNSNIGTIEDLGVDASGNGANGISAENSVNKNIASVNAAIGDLKNLSLDLKNLTNGKEATAENAPKSVVEALNNLDGTLGQIHGLATKLGSKYNGNLASGTTVEQHLTAIDAAIGNRKDITNTMSVNYDEAAIQNRNIASTISQVASNIGTAADLGENLINGVSATKTVNANIAAVNAAVGNIEDLKGTFLVSDAGNLTDAVRVLDADMYQLSGAVNTTWRDLKELHHEVRAGMASMAAMSALVPNPRAHGNTSLSLGTGAYSGHGAVAVGGFHHITDNLMLNAGVAWGNSRDAGYRMGVTYSF